MHLGAVVTDAPSKLSTPLASRSPARQRVPPRGRPAGHAPYEHRAAGARQPRGLARLARRRALAPGQDLSKIKLFENFKMQLKDMGRTEPTTVPDIGADKSPVFVRTLLQGMLSEVFRAASKLLGETPGPTVR